MNETDGSSDTSFDTVASSAVGSGGTYTDPVNDGARFFDVPGSGGCRDLAIQSDGKIVLVGSANSMSYVIRLLPTGVADTTFSGDGEVSTDLDDTQQDGFWSVAMGLHGTVEKIVAAGDTDTGTSPSQKMGVVRYR